MNAREWFAARCPDSASVDALSRPRARQLAALMLSESYDGVSLVECRRDPSLGDELLIAQIAVPLGQRPVVNNIKPMEEVAVLVARDDMLPHVYPLREDFPKDVPHLNVAPKGMPRSLCLYEAPADEVRRTYTALGFLERTRWWFGETAYGRLHGNDQPLDPLLAGAGLSLILPEEDAKPGTLFVAGRIGEFDHSPIQLAPIAAGTVVKEREQQGVYASLFITTKPAIHGQIKQPPLDLEELLTLYADVDADLRTKLGNGLVEISKSAHHSFLLDRLLLLVVSTPLTREGGEPEAKTTKAYLTVDATAGTVAIALGTLIKEAGMWAPPI